MSLKITSFKLKSGKLREFNKNEWKLIHPEHFGKEQDIKYWNNQKYGYQAVEGGNIVGTISGHYMAGVMWIDQLIVKHDKHGKGIGKTLMATVEKLARKKGIHKIYLETGVDWNAVKFYEALGYIREAKIKNLYEHKDFWIISKEIS